MIVNFSESKSIKEAKEFILDAISKNRTFIFAYKEYEDDKPLITYRAGDITPFDLMAIGHYLAHVGASCCYEKEED